MFYHQGTKTTKNGMETGLRFSWCLGVLVVIFFFEPKPVLAFARPARCAYARGDFLSPFSSGLFDVSICHKDASVQFKVRSSNMHDPSTWVTVADDAVKVGLGALIGGAASVATILLTRKNDSKKLHFEKRLELIKEVSLEIAKFGSTITAYWAKIMDARIKIDGGTSLSVTEENELENIQKESFRLFGELAYPRTKLSMLGELEARSALDELRKVCDEFYGIAVLTDPQCTPSELDRLKKEISSKRDAFLNQIEKSFNKPIKF